MSKLAPKNVFKSQQPYQKCIHKKNIGFYFIAKKINSFIIRRICGIDSENLKFLCEQKNMFILLVSINGHLGCVLFNMNIVIVFDQPSLIDT